ncbi:MAG TPA: hypothetical protein VGT98_17340 [Candidatus Elarobacter sp.]|nr:hypothetical protein [Candidatus Elarobacter sp.]
MSSGSYLWTGERGARPTSWRQTASRTAAVLFAVMLLLLMLGG